MDWFEKRLFKAIVVIAAVYFVLYLLISRYMLAGSEPNQIAWPIILVFILVFGFQFLTLYLPNYLEHNKLQHLYSDYPDLLKEKYDELGFERLLYSAWILNFEKRRKNFEI